MSTRAHQTAAVIQDFSYGELHEPDLPCAEWDLPRLDSQGRTISLARSAVATRSVTSDDVDRRVAEKSRRSFEAGRARGIEEGRAAERAGQIPAEQHRAEQLRRLLDQFVTERDHYLHALEHEAVRLALAIAARILRREAQMDPLLLLGAVRVVLGQLAASTEARLHVPAADADLWKEAIELLPNPSVRPIVIPDNSMCLGDCRLEASLGHVDLGIRSQLGEIERGFFDRIASAGDSAIPSEIQISAESQL